MKNKELMVGKICIFNIIKKADLIVNYVEKNNFKNLSKVV